MEWSRTGSKYDGRTKDRRMHGIGTYTFPTGSIYHGEFRDGEFHGDGTLTFTHGGKFVGEWRKGLAVEGRYIFADGLAMDDSTNPYCLPGRDRRFQTERTHGLKPAGRCQLTNQDPPVTIPAGMFDEGKGFFDPRTNHVVDYKTLKFVDTTGPDTHKWVKTACRKGWDEVVGFHQKDHSRPHKSDRSTWPPEKEGQVDLPTEFQRGTKVADRPPAVVVPTMWNSETQMSSAVTGVGKGRHRQKHHQPKQIGVGAVAKPIESFLPSTRRHRDASLGSASTSASIYCDGFDAVRRASSGEEEKNPNAEGLDEEEEEEEERGEEEEEENGTKNRDGGGEGGGVGDAGWSEPSSSSSSPLSVSEGNENNAEDSEGNALEELRSVERMLADIYRPSWLQN